MMMWYVIKVKGRKGIVESGHYVFDRSSSVYSKIKSLFMCSCVHVFFFFGWSKGSDVFYPPYCKEYEGGMALPMRAGWPCV